MIFTRKTMFDIIREAEEDNAPTGEGEEAPAADNNTEDTGNDAGAGDGGDESGNDDMSLDTSLDDDMGSDDAGGDDMGDGGSSDSSSDLDGGEEGEEKPVQANTDIFSSLSQDEQKIKITELKNLFNNLYTSIIDLTNRINELECDQFLETITRISMTLYELKKYVGDYILNIFPYKSYIENDIAFNRFLAILNSVSSVFDELCKEKSKMEEK